VIGYLDRESISEDVSQVFDPCSCRNGLSLVDETPKTTPVSSGQAEEMVRVCFYLLKRDSRTFPVSQVSPGEQLIQIGVSLSVFCQ
jgi:hypothetical protein